MTVTPATVRMVYTTTQKTDDELNFFINNASLIVAEELTGANPPLSAARLDLIITYLAAHFAAISEDGVQSLVKSQKMGDATEVYAVPANEYGFLSTMFGQQALALDSSGRLAASQANKGIRAQFEVVGDVWSTQHYDTTYYHRRGNDSTGDTG